MTQGVFLSIAWWNIDEKRQKSVYSLLNLNINFRSHNRLVHDNNDGKDGKCRTEKRKKISSGGQRDDIIRKNYILQDSREFFVIFFPATFTTELR